MSLPQLLPASVLQARGGRAVVGVRRATWAVLVAATVVVAPGPPLAVVAVVAVQMMSLSPCTAWSALAA